MIYWRIKMKVWLNSYKTNTDSVTTDNDISIVEWKWLSIDIDKLKKEEEYKTFLKNFIKDFLSNKKLDTIEFIKNESWYERMYYGKENFLQHLSDIKSGYQDFLTRIYLIEHGKYSEQDYLDDNFRKEVYDTLVHYTRKKWIFTPNKCELDLWKPISEIIFDLQLNQEDNKKINTKNHLRNTSISFAALCIILGIIKQNDDPQWLLKNKTFEKGKFCNIYNYNISNPDLPNWLRILHLSDLHFDVNKPEQVEKLKEISQSKDIFDIIVVTGDIFEPWSLNIVWDTVSKYFNKIVKKSKHGFFVLWNHDYYPGNQPDSIVWLMEKSWYKNANNNYYNINVNGKNIWVVWLDDLLFGNPKKVEIDNNDNTFNIMLIHELDWYNPLQYNNSVDLILSWHLHSWEIELWVINLTIWIKWYENKNNQLVWIKQLDDWTMSIISPWMTTNNPLWTRLWPVNSEWAVKIIFDKIKR